jgi:hypothetical protein
MEAQEARVRSLPEDALAAELLREEEVGVEVPAESAEN